MTIAGRDRFVARIIDLAKVNLEGRCEGRGWVPNLLALSKLFASREGTGRQDEGRRHPRSRAGGVEGHGTTQSISCLIPYYAVRRQMFFILRAMNRERRSRGFKPVPEYVLRTRLRKVKPFEQPAGTDAKAA